MNYQLSIIVPIYNGEKYLEKCLDSLINQTYKNIEIICINDGSVDESLTILKEYQKCDSRINIINQANHGLSEVRNIGMDLAKGDYITFVDCDDWIDLNTCEVIVEKIHKFQPEVIMFPYIKEYTNNSVNVDLFQQNDIYFINENLQNLHRRFVGMIGNELRHPEQLCSLSTVCMKFYSKKLFENTSLKFVDTKEIGSYEDGIFNMFLFDNVHSAFYTDEIRYHYRRSEMSTLTNTFRPNLINQYARMNEIMSNYVYSNNTNISFIEAFQNKVALDIIPIGLNIESSNLTFLEKVRTLSDYLNMQEYTGAIKKLKFNYLDIKWKVFFFLVKKRITVLVLAFLYIMNTLRHKG